MGTSSLQNFLTSLNYTHVQHLHMPNYHIHQRSLLLLNMSGFQVCCTEGTEPVVNKDGKNQPDMSLSLCLLSKALHSLARQYFSFSRTITHPSICSITYWHVLTQRVAGYAGIFNPELSREHGKASQAEILWGPELLRQHTPWLVSLLDKKYLIS